MFGRRRGKSVGRGRREGRRKKEGQLVDVSENRIYKNKPALFSLPLWTRMEIDPFVEAGMTLDRLHQPRRRDLSKLNGREPTAKDASRRRERSEREEKEEKERLTCLAVKAPQNSKDNFVLEGKKGELTYEETTRRERSSGTHLERFFSVQPKSWNKQAR
ncbi:hypothetical protein BDY24DRAFT_11917 [Mrakia frigida]|uniref:uncharacterized protein n=1 Tax=Mrakia frigida TaxID=29902 RepID=UPI003FCC022B